MLVALAAAAAASLVGATWMMRAAARGRTYADPHLIPHRHVGLVLGCAPRLADGARNPFFRYRIEAAAELFRAGKVDVLLASGETLAGGYDESAELKAGLIAAGVPPSRIFCDPGGARTLDSVVRAREVFGQRMVTIITQAYHIRRALFLSAHRGVDAIGFSATDLAVRDSLWIHAREPLADAVAVLDVLLSHPSPRAPGQPVTIP